MALYTMAFLKSKRVSAKGFTSSVSDGAEGCFVLAFSRLAGFLGVSRDVLTGAGIWCAARMGCGSRTGDAMGAGICSGSGVLGPSPMSWRSKSSTVLDSSGAYSSSCP